MIYKLEHEMNVFKENNKKTRGYNMEKSNEISIKDKRIEELENLAFIDLGGNKITLELLESQKYKNVEKRL